MDSFSDIFKSISTSEKETRLRFYERLGFNLTIAIRSIWSDPDSSDKDKLERIKIINELSHRIYHWTWQVRRHDTTFKDHDCASVIKNFINQDRVLVGEMGEAIRSSYRTVVTS